MKSNYEKGYAAGYSAALDEISKKYYQEIKKLKLTLIANEQKKLLIQTLKKLYQMLYILNHLQL